MVFSGRNEKSTELAVSCSLAASEREAEGDVCAGSIQLEKSQIAVFSITSVLIEKTSIG